LKGIPEHIIEIILVLNKRVLTPFEKEELEVWLSENPDNKDDLDKMAKIIGQIDLVTKYTQINIDKAWNRVDRTTSDKPGWKKGRRLQFLKVAASFILPILTVGIAVFSLLNQPELDQEATQLNNIAQPGSSKAILELYDGQVIKLGEGSAEQIANQKGITIGTVSTQELKYNLAHNSNAIQYNTLCIPRGGEWDVVLSDGTKVKLNSETRFKHPINFNGNTREVFLEYGEAHFEVAEDKEVPFVVHGNNSQVEVLGTGFNIRAYKDEAHVYTTLVHGSVKVGSARYNTLLKPNQQAIISNESQKIEVKEVDVTQTIGWVEGILYFNNQTLEDIMRDLGRWYNFEYRFENEEIAKIKFGGGITKYNDIDLILDVINTTNKLITEIEGDVIIFKHK